MVAHAYNPNSQEAGEKGSKKIAKFSVMGTHHSLTSGLAAPGEGMKGRKKLSGGRDGLKPYLKYNELDGGYLSVLYIFLFFKIKT